MCENNIVLIIFIILKILILLIVPIIMVFLYRNENKFYYLVGAIEIVCIITFIILRLFGNGCIKNSNIWYFNNNKEESVIYENPDTEYINSTESYSIDLVDSNNGKSAYIYNINILPLKNISFMCDRKNYMTNYGNSITGVTMLMANTFESDFDENEIIKVIDNSDYIDCEKGVNFEGMFNALSKKYGFVIKEISSSEIDNYILKGTSVLAETINKPDEDYNFGCRKDYIIIYNKNNNYYNIINPNDKSYSYFCPSNTIGYGSIIDGNQNINNYTFSEIDSKTIKYFVIEVK